MYIVGTLVENRRLAEGIHLLRFRLARKLKRSPMPGNYMMVWLPGSGEIPLSAYNYSERPPEISFIVEAVGPRTERLNSLAQDSRIGLRGPYGNGFSIGKYRSYMLVAGGIGAPPIIYALRKVGGRAVYLFGARTASKVFMIDELIEEGYEVHVSTDDGSMGFRGYVTQLAESMLRAGRKFDVVMACGPDAMIKKLYMLAKKYSIGFEASFTRIVKCGVGICGSCVLEPLGLRVCVDGPVFKGQELEGLWSE